MSLILGGGGVNGVELNAKEPGATAPTVSISATAVSAAARTDIWNQIYARKLLLGHGPETTEIIPRRRTDSDILRKNMVNNRPLHGPLGEI